MFIPIRTDYRMTVRPWVNYALIAANIVIHVLASRMDPYDPVLRSMLLYPDAPQLSQFFTSIFLHADWMHLLGNMLFLWVFGNALNDRLGHVAYLAFYLGGGVLAGVGYVLLAGDAPVLGASGAICGVTGAYLVLFPRVRLTVLMWLFYFITTMQVSSLFFVGFQALYNFFMTLVGAERGVAYAAHSSGYVYGIVVGFGLLGLKLVPRDGMDLLAMLSQSQRRQRYRRMVSRGYNPFQGTGPGGRPATVNVPSRGRWVQARSVQTAPPDSEVSRELQLRREISRDCAAHNLADAAEKYLQLVQIADDAVLSKQNQLDVANQLMAAEQNPAAADAYERLLKHYPNYEHAPDIYLMLGLLYGRYLHQDDRAEHYLGRAAETLSDSGKAEMARRELQAVRQNRSR